MSTNILITGKIHPDAINALSELPNTKVVNRADCSFEEYAADLAKAQVLITRSETTVDRHLIDHATELKTVVRAAVGVGNIDLPYATERGILVINTPGKNTNSAAELTLALMLSLLRKIPQAQETMKAGGWDRHRFSGNELRGKTVGLVGLGNVGHRVAKFCLGFDAKVLAYDPYISDKQFARHGVIKVDTLSNLAKSCDILSVHVPKNTETTGMVTAEILRELGPKGIFINAARGGIADENDLVDALKNKTIAAAALDTFDNEPNPLQALVHLENLWCSPHIGASTEEAQKAIGETVVEQVSKALAGTVVDHHVNLPEIGVIEEPILKAYATLAEKLGSLVGQIIDFNPSSVTLQYRGDIAELDNSILKLSFMKGYAGHVAEDFVSFVNASREFDKLGISVQETKDPGFSGYKSALKILIEGSKLERLTVGGVVFEENLLRLTLIDDFYFELEPRGPIVLMQNEDRPGVIGKTGLALADAGINISSFNLSRNKQGGRAMALLGVDSYLSSENLRELEKIPHVIRARMIRL